jgi:hypothetical protein
MWEGVTYVEPSRRPIIHEGTAAAQAIVMNAGPGAVDLLVWSERTSDRAREPTFRMFMPPGDMRSVSGPMIGVAHSEKQPGSGAHFAAVAWRMVR